MNSKVERRWLLHIIISTASFPLWSLTGCCSFRTMTTTSARPPTAHSFHGTRIPSRVGNHHQVGATSSSSSSFAKTPQTQQDEIEERFSVAPMMGHTHRHYHTFFSRISRRATLYTEMIPAAQVVAAFQEQFSFQLEGCRSSTRPLGLDQVLDLLAASSSSSSSSSRGHRPLDSLMQMANLSPSPSSSSNHDGMKQRQPIVLQLGGSDPQQLALATAIGAHYGYDSVNLNCGCPSNAVSQGERSGGAALMRSPSVAAACVEAMSQAIDYYCSMVTSTGARRKKPTLSVKHRLGVHDATTYNAQADRARSDGDYQTFLQCRDFVRAISLAGDVSKVQVHARLGLLGDYDPERTSSSSSADSLWVPGMTTTGTASTGDEVDNKVDHKRLQYQAKKRARQVTIQNRSVPPLRPSVVDAIAAEFPQLQVITNGGIRSMKDIDRRVPRPESKIMGAMVGRAVINHPCSFGNVDTLWDDTHSNDRIQTSKPTRAAVPLDYMEYCNMEEDAYIANETSRRHRLESPSLSSFRRRLVAVPYHLFAGEDGNEEYQRRIRKLARLARHSSVSILTAALAAIPVETALKPVNEYSTEIDDIPTFEAWTKRSGPLQRTIL